jgi:leucyl aminopeptidase
MAWNIRSLPGRPEGGEAMGMRAVFELIRQRIQD